MFVTVTLVLQNTKMMVLEIVLMLHLVVLKAIRVMAVLNKTVLLPMLHASLAIKMTELEHVLMKMMPVLMDLEMMED